MRGEPAQLRGGCANLQEPPSLSVWVGCGGLPVANEQLRLLHVCEQEACNDGTEHGSGRAPMHHSLCDMAVVGSRQPLGKLSRDV
jgi:hypothetical protein